MVPVAYNDSYLNYIGSPDGGGGDNGEIRRPTSNTSALIVDSGNLTTDAVPNSSGYYSASISPTKLVKNTTYFFYAVAGNYIDDSILSTQPAYVTFKEFQLIDTEIPKVTSVTIDSWSANPYSLTSIPKNSANVTVNFDRPVYIDSTGTAVAVDSDTAGVTDATGDQKIWSINPDKFMAYDYVNAVELEDYADRTYTVKVLGGTSVTNQSLNFVISNINHLGGNKTVTLRSTSSMCSSGGTNAGTFILKLETSSASDSKDPTQMTSTCVCTASLVRGSETTSSATSKPFTSDPFRDIRVQQP